MQFNVERTTKEEVLKLLRREQVLRYSDEVQKLYDEGLNRNGDQEFVEKWVQSKVLQEHGYTDDNISRSNYNSIGYHYGEDPEVKQSVQYFRINIMKDCAIPIDTKYVDADLVMPDGTPTKLSEHYNPRRPLVILAGSITWPPFRQAAEAYKEFYEKYKGVLDVLCVYILEAHFVNKDVDGKVVEGWPIGSQYHIPQHKTLEDRLGMMNTFIDQYSWPIPTVVDSMHNDFNTKYAAWPDRAYVIFEGKLKYFSRLNSDGSRDTFWTDEIEKLF